MRLCLVVSISAVIALSLGAQQLPSTGSVTNQRVVELVHGGVSDQELTRIIASAPAVSFNLTPQATDEMLKAGVSEGIIKQMAAREKGVLQAPGDQAAKLPAPSGPIASGSRSDSGANSETIPRVTLFVGGAYLRTHASGAEDAQVVGVPDFVLQQRNLNFNLYGWNTTITENVSRWLGADFDVSGLYGLPVPNFLCSASSISKARSCLSSNPVRPAVITKIHTFAFGPRFSFRHSGRLVPFAHVLVGVGHIDGSINGTSIFTPIPTLLPQGFSKSNTALVVTPGAGLDFVMNRRVAVHLFEVDYVMTRFYNQRQDSARVSAGVTFRFGSK